MGEIAEVDSRIWVREPILSWDVDGNSVMWPKDEFAGMSDSSSLIGSDFGIVSPGLLLAH